MTIRRVGKVTAFLFRQDAQSGFKIPLLGVGGEFRIEQRSGEGEVRLTPFIAAGVGITPLLGQITSLVLTPAAFRLFWTVRRDGLGLVADALAAHPALAPLTNLFVTGAGVDGKDDGVEEELEQLREQGVAVQLRRLTKGDFEGVDAQRWYLCAGGPLRKQVLSWLPNREVLFEDFDY